MALYVIVLTPSRSGRLDKTMQDRIIEIASMGKPTLVCINQMSRYMDWCSSAAEAKSKCEEVCEGIRTKTPKCGSLKVYLTEMVQHDAHYQDMKTRDIKNVEDVRVPVPVQCSHTAFLYVAFMLFGCKKSLHRMFG